MQQGPRSASTLTWGAQAKMKVGLHDGPVVHVNSQCANNLHYSLRNSCHDHQTSSLSANFLASGSLSSSACPQASASSSALALAPHIYGSASPLSGTRHS